MVQEFPPPVQLVEMLFGFASARAIGVSAELRIVDLLKDGSKTLEELAQQTNVHSRSLYRLFAFAGRSSLRLSRVFFTWKQGSTKAVGEEHQPSGGKRTQVSYSPVNNSKKSQLISGRCTC